MWDDGVVVDSVMGMVRGNVTPPQRDTPKWDFVQTA